MTRSRYLTRGEDGHVSEKETRRLLEAVGLGRHGDVAETLKIYRGLSGSQETGATLSVAEARDLRDLAQQAQADKEESGIPVASAASLRLASKVSGTDVGTLMQKQSAFGGAVEGAFAQSYAEGKVFKFTSAVWVHALKAYGKDIGLGDIADRIQETKQDSLTIINIYDKETARRILVLQNNPMVSAAIGAKFLQEKDHAYSSGLMIDGIKKFDLPVREVAAGAETEPELTGEKRADVLNTALQLKGKNEQEHGAEISRFMQLAKINIDPQETEWCAAYANAVLKRVGIKGTGKLNARSFLDFGEATTDPKPGDLAVFKRGSDEANGHVGFVVRRYPDGHGGWKVDILGGNQGSKGDVSVHTRSEKDLLGYRSLNIDEGERGAIMQVSDDETHHTRSRHGHGHGHGHSRKHGRSHHKTHHRPESRPA